MVLKTVDSIDSLYRQFVGGTWRMLRGDWNSVAGRFGTCPQVLLAWDLC